MVEIWSEMFGFTDFLGLFGLNGHVILFKIDTEDMFFLQNAEDGSLPFLNFKVEQLILLFTF